MTRLLLDVLPYLLYPAALGTGIAVAVGAIGVAVLSLESVADAVRRRIKGRDE